MGEHSGLTSMDRDRFAAIETYGWLTLLEQCAAGKGSKCPDCNGAGGADLKGVSGRYHSLPCGRCNMTGRLSPPDLVTTCMVFSDWLEDHGDPRAGLVRPSDHTVTPWQRLPDKSELFGSTELWKKDDARRLLLLFRRECERCEGKGRHYETNEVETPNSHVKCQGCSGLGYLPLPVPVLVRAEKCKACNGSGWEKPGLNSYGDDPCGRCYGSGSVVPPVRVPEEVAVCPDCRSALRLEGSKFVEDFLADFAIGGCCCKQVEWRHIRQEIKKWSQWRVRLVG